MAADTRAPLRTRSLALAAAGVLASCGLEPGAVAGDAGPGQGSAGDRLAGENGMSRNGMSRNGLSRNGLSRNGLSLAAFDGDEVRTWFDADPALGDMVMTYVARCAAPAGKTYAWTSPTSGATYSWSGLLGLAPDFAAGAAPSVAERQVITACLAAHVNVYALSVPISISGYGATGAAIAHEAGEWSTFAEEEGAFFGNVFDEEGVYVCQKHGPYPASLSSSRACAFDTSAVGPSPVCSPLFNVGPCSAVCSSWRNKDHAWAQCSWNGVGYRPLSTRIRSADLYRCGDGVCQVSERCGSGTTAASCAADCGLCP
jgi:hypothetical protein